jgi:cation diffusion facilitator CzcD-associated flavoprotein CzcO
MSKQVGPHSCLYQKQLIKYGKGEVFYDECNVLIGCYGNLNRPKMADIKDLDVYKGKLIHPARWDHSVDLSGKKVAVIGNGSSALQIIPAIFDQVESLDNYVRSKTWITSGFGGDLVPVEGVHETRGAGGVNFSYTKEDMTKFREDKDYYTKYERALRDALACLHLITFKGSPLADGAQQSTAGLMRSKSLKKPEIAEAIIPDWAIGCRRLTPGTPYIEALCEEKCQMISETIERFDETGIVTTEGQHRAYDVIIVASGYDLSYKVCPLYGRNGVNLNDIYDEAPESYLGVCPPEMPSKFNVLSFVLIHHSNKYIRLLHASRTKRNRDDRNFPPCSRICSHFHHVLYRQIATRANSFHDSQAVGRESIFGPMRKVFQ